MMPIVTQYPQSDTHEAGARGASSDGVNATSDGSSADTKGAYVELISSLAAECQGIHLIFQFASSSTNYLCDIAVGAAASEQVIINNLMVGCDLNGNVYQAGLWLPINIAAGTRVSARSQAHSGTSKVLKVAANFVAAKGTSVGFKNCETIGADIVNTKGTTIDSGATANTKGAYSELSAGITGNWKHVAMALSNVNDFGISIDNRHLVDIAHGEAGSESVVFGDFPYDRDTSFDVNEHSLYGAIPLKIDSEERVAMRSQCSSNASDARLIDAILYGFYD